MKTVGTTATDLIREGVRNLVSNCLDVQPGESILLLNERGRIAPELVDLMEEGVRQCRGECHSLWGETIERGQRTFPKVLLGALLSADKVIMNYNLDREVLHQYVKDHQILRVTNRCLRPELFATEHARFHWGMVRAIFAHLEEIVSDASEWHITGSGGTDLSGKMADASDVAGAYFVQEAEATRLIRVFPGEVYTPVGVKEASGRIVADAPNVDDPTLSSEPVTFTIENSRIVRIDGEERAQRVRDGMEAAAARFGHESAYTIDSWHGGMNPRADSNPRGIGGISTTERMHFHARTLGGNFGATVGRQTIEVGRKTIFENGKLTVLNDPELREAAVRFGVEDWPPA